MSFSLAWHGTRIYITLRQRSIDFTLRGPHSRPVWVRGEQLDLPVDETVTVPLDDQGPLREGRPTLDHVLSLQAEAGAEVPIKPW